MKFKKSKWFFWLNNKFARYPKGRSAYPDKYEFDKWKLTISNQMLEIKYENYTVAHGIFFDQTLDPICIVQGYEQLYPIVVRVMNDAVEKQKEQNRQIISRRQQIANEAYVNSKFFGPY